MELRALMAAWENLISGSTIANGDAWEHLLAQGGGGGDTTIIYVTGGLDGTMEKVVLDATISPSDLQAILVDPGELSATAHEITLLSTIQEITLDGKIVESELTGVIE